MDFKVKLAFYKNDLPICLLFTNFQNINSIEKLNTFIKNGEILEENKKDSFGLYLKNKDGNVFKGKYIDEYFEKFISTLNLEEKKLYFWPLEVHINQ